MRIGAAYGATGLAEINDVTITQIETDPETRIRTERQACDRAIRISDLVRKCVGTQVQRNDFVIPYITRLSEL